MSIKGSGILVIENYKNNLVAVLFGNQDKEYSDLGGVIDSGENVLNAACREAREESANLIKIEPNELNKIGTPVVHLSYKAYIIYIKNLSMLAYQHNVKKIFQDCKRHVWKENSSMVRIPLNRLIESVEKGVSTVRDTNNTKINMRSRVLKIAEKGLDVLKNMHLQIPHNLYQNVTLDSRMQCLIGTYTYTLKQNDPKVDKAMPQKSLYKYAIYVIPNLKEKDKSLNKCNERWGGIHITLVGFSANHPPIKPNLEYLSQIGKIGWKIRGNTIRIQNNAIYFDSNTLDKIARYLTQNTFQKVKGKRFSGVDWHISMNCAITETMINVLKNVTWSLCIVRDNNDGTYSWMDKYKINKV